MVLVFQKYLEISLKDKEQLRSKHKSLILSTRTYKNDLIACKTILDILFDDINPDTLAK
jgi:hypothetical protein